MMEQEHTGRKWLSLEQACERLGVHAATLRRWADRGQIDVFVTPGGHRRFLLQDIERFAGECRRARQQLVSSQPWTESAIARARQSLAAQPWVALYGEAERAYHRQLGRRLIGLVFQFVSRPDEDPDLLREAHSIGEQEARISLSQGQTVVDTLRAISFFRSTLLEVAVLDMLKDARTEPEASAHLLRRIEQLLSEVQIGAVQHYVDQAQPRAIAAVDI